ncbi:hypothetical protein [Sphingomonas sp.]|jgi:pyridoxine/pyridoxamine 5'-phosphate oxidase|uniref:hypothetical protein n=1 Tax=Sphingomonas sp. TaxID=28214 RepID=UPI002D7EC097|nr:hypothetical protein [Sphingomonas sp.]HEU0044163.1 hypothetical protein [Sphingomonas sp.]
MSELNHAEYYRSRERHARIMAASAVSPEIRAIHADFADRYALLAGKEMPTTPAPAPRLQLALS